MDLNEESIPAPPDAAYNSFNEAYSALKEHGIRYGYGFRINTSRPTGSSIKTRIYYCCDKSRQYNSQARVRKTSTRTDNCPFKLIIYQKDSQWMLQVTNDQHSHPPSLDPRTHHVYRKRTPAQKAIIKSQSKAGIEPKRIMTTIRQEDPQTFIQAQDIYNERISARADYLNRRSPMEALLDELSTPEWISDVKLDADNHVQNLFFAHQNQVELLLANPDILLMDCTYRTNRYRLPLLHILGCTNLGTFFSAGFCFLKEETELDYYWAISTFLRLTNVSHPQVFISDQEQALKSAAQELLPSVP
jgi:hypothetical protein